MKLSSAESLASLPEEQRKAILESLTELQAEELIWDWEFWARPAQKLPEGDWLTWLIMTGRGWGKTKTGSESIRQWVCGDTPLAAGKFRRLALIAETAADARDVMVEGESGILACHPPDFRPLYEPSKRRLTWPNGAVASLFNATEPDQLRGPQFDAAWCDELAKWQYARETWDMLQFGLRLGDSPQQIVTTTPRPIPVLKELIKSPSTVMTRGSTKENVGNLAPSFLRQIRARYEGTRLGRQELDAEVLDDNPNALWNRKMIEDALVVRENLPRFARTVVAVDPSGTKGNEEGDDIGIVAAAKGVDGKMYVLHDRTCQESPAAWGAIAVRSYHELQADRVVAERNFGGAMVEHVLRTADKNVSYKEVVASRGKWIRAEPVAALYEQGRVKHVGSFPKLEDEMCSFGLDGLSDGRSPNRLDALVWAATELMLGDTQEVIKREWWKNWTADKTPRCSHLIAALYAGFSDVATTDPAALTVWGVFDGENGPNAILFYSWEGRASVNDLADGLSMICSPRPAPPADKARIAKAFGITKTFPQYPIGRLVIEASTTGDAVRREIVSRAFGNDVIAEVVDTKRWGDPIARLHGVQGMFAEGMICAPFERQYAQRLINSMSEFPNSASPSLTHSASLALQYMRDTGMLLRSEEHNRSQREQMMHRGRGRPLYDA